MSNRTDVSKNEIREKVVQILIGLNVPEKDARTAVDVIMDAELSGMESHGLIRARLYADRLAKGVIEANPVITVEEHGAVAVVDGGNGLGQVVMSKATETAIRLAKEYGIGAVTVRHSNHFGTAGYYANILAKAGCIGLSSTMAGPTMAPHGGKDKLLGTNPIAIGFPAEKQIFCGDMATSGTAIGKLPVYESKGLPIQPGWALDKDGNDTTDPVAAMKGILLPLGGHKGYALAMAVDAICALLSGACLSCESASIYSTDMANTGHFALAVDIEHFLPLDEFKARAQAWFERLKASTPRNGFDEVLIPGEPEDRKRAESAGDTISVLTETVEFIDQYYQKYAPKA